MSKLSEYHLGELAVVQDRADPRRCVPEYECGGWDVLDVGCGIGQTLAAPEFAGAASRHGIDIDVEAIKLGRGMFPEFALSVARAEAIPYSECRFDLVFSRVALPYTNVPLALSEMRRVTKPGGVVWLLLHPWRMELSTFVEALKKGNMRRSLDRTYVIANSVALAITGRCFARPWTHTYESFQLAGSMRRLMHALSFRDVLVSTGNQFYISGRKAGRN